MRQLSAFLTLVMCLPAAGAPGPFALKAVDRDSGVPLADVQIETTGNLRFRTDSTGYAAFFEPGLMETTVFFTPTKKGYMGQAGFFGIIGQQFITYDGGQGTLLMDRLPDAGGPSVASDAGDISEATKLFWGVPAPGDYFRMRFLDADSGRGIPLVRVNDGRHLYVSDSAGEVAYFEPVWFDAGRPFDVFSQGYRTLADGGTTVLMTPKRGGSVTVKLDRTNVAERLYRLTGQGIYRDSVLMNLPVPLANPVNAGRVIGQDGSESALYKGQGYSAWGDTLQAPFAFGNFYTSVATYSLADAGGLDIEQGVNFNYFVADSGFVRPACPLPTVDGGGPVWTGALVAVNDKNGNETLLALYMKEIAGALDVPEETGIAKWNDTTQVFEKVVRFSDYATDFLDPGPHGHAHKVWHGDAGYVYFIGATRVPALAEAMYDAGAYESYSPFVAGSSVLTRRADGGVIIPAPVVDREGDGGVRYGWKKGARELARQDCDGGFITEAQCLAGHARDMVDGGLIPASLLGQMEWNAYRKRFLHFTTRAGFLGFHSGDVVYGEGDTPMGPFVWYRNVAEHPGSTMYLPARHAHWDKAGGRLVYFEGTYTQSFAFTNFVPTPRYDYNQLLYKLDLADDRLFMPVPVYAPDALRGATLVTKTGLRPTDVSPFIAFLAPDRPMPGTQAVTWSGASCRSPQLLLGAASNLPPLFYALPLSVSAPETVELLEFVRAADGRRAYSTNPAWTAPGFGSGTPVMRVWKNPIAVNFPVEQYLGPVVAVAGDDVCVTSSAPDAGVAVPLDASASTGTITSYTWQSAAGTQTGKTANATFPVGTTVVTLTVVGPNGESSRATRIVDVAPFDTGTGGGTGGSAGGGTGGAGGFAGSGGAGGGATGGGNTSGGGGGTAGGGGGGSNAMPPGCGCGAGSALWPLGAMVLLWRRRARRGTAS